MATSNPHNSTANINPVHPSRQTHVPSEPNRKKRKRANIPTNLGAHSYKKAHTVNDLKSTIRSLRRLLDRDDGAEAEKRKRLPATVRVEKERALATARGELEAAERARKRSEIIGRWHKVRFFERRNGERRVRRLGREGEGEAEEGKRKRKRERKLEEAKVDVAYAQYFPLETEYVPLWPRKGGRKGEGEVVEAEVGVDYKDGERMGDPVMWELVRKCMAEGTLDGLRNGTLPEVGGEPENEGMEEEEEERPVKVSKKGAKDKMSSKETAKVERAEDDDSDGGFFE